ncbi:hypothetical protein [Nostoc sp.]
MTFWIREWGDEGDEGDGEDGGDEGDEGDEPMPNAQCHYFTFLYLFL